MMGTMRPDEPLAVEAGCELLLVVMVVAVAVVVEPFRPGAAVAGVPNLNILKKFRGAFASFASLPLSIERRKPSNEPSSSSVAVPRAREIASSSPSSN